MNIKTNSPCIFSITDYPICIDNVMCTFKPTENNWFDVNHIDMTVCKYQKMRNFPDNVGLFQLMSDLDAANMTALEIGVYAGEGTQIMLDSGKIDKIFCVDPWKPAEKFQLPEALFDCYLRKDKRVIKVKGTIDTWLEKFNTKIDMVYIDGGHSYENTKYIIQTLLSKVKPKILAGHDYINNFPGVVKAVNELLGKPDKMYCDGSYVKNYFT